MNLSEHRFYTLDALKFFTAIGIVFHHYQQVTGVVFSRFNFYGGRIYFGYLVELFFILSGFFMAVHIEKHKGLQLKEFLLGKMIRLYPAAIISGVVFCVSAWIFRFLTGFWWKNNVIGIWNAFVSLLLIHTGGVVPRNGIAANNPTWYLCVLLICYILYWFILKIASKLKVSPIYFFILGLLVGMAVYGFRMNLPFFNQYTARGYIGFFWGIILYFILLKRKYEVRIKYIAFSILVLCGIAWIVEPNELYDNFSMILVYLVYPSLIVIMLTSKIMYKLFYHRVFGIFSGISFEMYLWHSPIMVISSIIVYITAYQPNYTYVSMILFTILVFVISTILYFLVEIPVTQWLKKKMRRKNE